MTRFSYAAGGDRNMNRSCPLLAAASAAARALISLTEMWSTMTSVLCFAPHSLVKVLSNHLSYAGTKWVHCTIFNVLRLAHARCGKRKAEVRPAAERVANCLRLIPSSRRDVVMVI